MRNTNTEVFWTLFDSPIGTTYVASTKTGVCRVSIPQETREHFLVWLRDHFAPENIHPHPEPNIEAVVQLESYFRGERKRFALHLDLFGTDFQKAVWNELLDIPYGRTKTYGAVADQLGLPGGAQAVGAAIGQNPVLVIVPCHRVLGVDGSLTGYAGGIRAKEWLLRHEGALLL